MIGLWNWTKHTVCKSWQKMLSITSTVLNTVRISTLLFMCNFLWTVFFYTKNVGEGVALYTGNFLKRIKIMHFHWLVALYTGKFCLMVLKFMQKNSGYHTMHEVCLNTSTYIK